MRHQFDTFLRAILLCSLLIGVFAGKDLLGSDQDLPHIGAYQAVTSPSGRLIALAGIALGEVSPSFRLRLRVLIVDVPTAGIHQILTGVEQKWIVIWSGEDVLLVAGVRDFDSSYGITAYEWSSGQTVRRDATDKERATADSAFRLKYGQIP